MKSALNALKKKGGYCCIELFNGGQIECKVSDIQEDSVVVTNIIKHSNATADKPVISYENVCSKLTISLNAIAIVGEIG